MNWNIPPNNSGHHVDSLFYQTAVNELQDYNPSRISEEETNEELNLDRQIMMEWEYDRHRSWKKAKELTRCTKRRILQYDPTLRMGKCKWIYEAKRNRFKKGDYCPNDATENGYCEQFHIIRGPERERLRRLRHRDNSLASQSAPPQVSLNPQYSHPSEPQYPPHPVSAPPLARQSISPGVSQSAPPPVSLNPQYSHPSEPQYPPHPVLAPPLARQSISPGVSQSSRNLVSLNPPQYLPLAKQSIPPAPPPRSTPPAPPPRSTPNAQKISTLVSSFGGYATHEPLDENEPTLSYQSPPYVSPTRDPMDVVA